MDKHTIGLSMLYCLGEPFRKMTKNLLTTEAKYIEVVDEGLHVLNNKRASILKNIGESYNFKYSVHAPFADINIASPSKPIFKAIIKRLKKSIAYANALNAYLWVFHPGLKTGVSSFYPGKAWRQNLQTVNLLLNIANDYGMKIAIENVPEPHPFLIKSVEDFTKFFKDLGREIGLVFDVAHANLNKQIERFITVFADKIVHIHVSDNFGKSDRHLGIGHGIINWKKIVTMLSKSSYDKAVIIESIENIEESYKRMKQVFSLRKE